MINNLLVLFGIVLLSSSCKLPPVIQLKFNRKDWDEKVDWDYVNRDEMVNDLLAHHKLKGLTYKQLIDSLGQPENMGKIDGVYYQVLMDFGSDIDPVHTKYLVFKLNKDSIVNSYGITEWEKGKN